MIIFLNQLVLFVDLTLSAVVKFIYVKVKLKKDTAMFLQCKWRKFVFFADVPPMLKKYSYLF